MAYVLRAHCIHDIEADAGVIEVTVMCIHTGPKKEFIYTTPRGNWQDISFHHLEYMDYADFLRLMVCRNHEVEKKIATVELIHNSDVYSIRSMNCLRILDPSFRSPYVNIKNSNHMDLVQYINTVVAPRFLNECTDTLRITSYADALRRQRQ